MGWTSVSFVLATAVTVWISRKRPDALTAALVLATLQGLSLAANRLGVSQDARLTINVTCDVLAAIGFVLSWRIIWPPRNWLFVLALTFFAQVTAHRVFDGMHDAWAAYRLQFMLNVLAFAQLATVVIGPRAGQMVTHARDAFASWFRAPRTRVRRGGVVASVDQGVRWIGGERRNEASE